MYDTFSATSLDTTNRWQASVSGGGGVAATVTNSALVVGTGTTANGYSYQLSQPSFLSSTPGWIRFGCSAQVEFPATVNAYRFWGLAQPKTVPCVDSPILNGVGFELTVSGSFVAVVYLAGIRTAVATLPTIPDANPHNYQVYYRPTMLLWYVDDNPVVTSAPASVTMNIDTFPVCYLAIANNPAPLSSATLASSGMSVSDTAKNNVQISDGTYAWRKATVSSTGALMTSVSDIDLALRRIVKLMEPNSVVDPRFRQIVTLGAIKASEASAPTELAGTMPVSGNLGTSLTLGSQVPVAGPPYAATGTQVIQAVAETPVDQRWRVAEDSHISYQVGIRNRLDFS
jgi:hypothetical protein